MGTGAGRKAWVIEIAVHRTASSKRAAIVGEAFAKRLGLFPDSLGKLVLGSAMRTAR